MLSVVVDDDDVVDVVDDAGRVVVEVLVTVLSLLLTLRSR